MFLAAALQEMVVVCALTQPMLTLVVEHLQLFFTLHSLFKIDHWIEATFPPENISFIFYQLNPKIQIVTQSIVFTSIESNVYVITHWDVISPL